MIHQKRGGALRGLRINREILILRKPPIEVVPDLTINPDSLYYAFKVDMSGQFLATPITRWASAL